MSLTPVPSLSEYDALALHTAVLNYKQHPKTSENSYKGQPLFRKIEIVDDVVFYHLNKNVRDILSRTGRLPWWGVG